MKGLFFAKPIEYRIETPADQLVQGDSFHGTMVMANRGAGPEQKLRMAVGLAYGDFRKIKDGEPGGLEVIEERALSEGVKLEPGAEHRAEWDFALGSDCPITSKEGSLFLLYGRDLADETARSKIDLQVKLSPVLEAMVASIENHFAFAAKSRGYAEGFTEVRFKPPASYPTLEEMTVLMRLHDKEGMELNFRCKAKKFDRGAAKGVKTHVIEIKHCYPREKYLVHNTQPNRPLYRDIVEEVLNKATPGRVEKK